MLKDMTGKRFGRLEVISRGKNRGKKTYWLCKCDCGGVVEVSGTNLRQGHTQSCGCKQAERTSEANSKREPGKRYGRLIVLEKTPPRGRARTVNYLCLCDCGSVVEVNGANLRSGNTKSCGCLKRERAADRLRQEEVSYSGAHSRVRRVRGSAKNQTCTGCGNKASQWSYSFSGVRERGEWKTDTRTGVSREMLYSLDPDQYDALCVGCHNLRDIQKSKEKRK